MENNLLSLKSDWVFKRIFGKEGNQDILADFLSAILDEEVKKVEIKNTELTKNKQKQKTSILDIKAELNTNIICDIEMQITNEHNMIDRDLQYLTKLYAEQLEAGQDYTKTKKVIVINVLNYDLYDINTYHSIAHLKFEPYTKETYVKIYDKEQTTLTDKLEIHIIELQKFLRLKEVKDTKLTQWLWLISGEGEKIQMALSKNAEKIKKAYEELQYLSQDEKARMEYDEYMQAESDRKGMISYATQKGEKKGIKIGKTIGLAEGKNIGKKEKTIEIVKKMLKSNMPIKDIMNITELTEEEINDLKKSM